MKVADLFKHRGETITKQHSEFMQWMTPTVKEYWGEIVNKLTTATCLLVCVIFRLLLLMMKFSLWFSSQSLLS